MKPSRVSRICLSKCFPKLGNPMDVVTCSSGQGLERTLFPRKTTPPQTEKRETKEKKRKLNRRTRSGQWKKKKNKRKSKGPWGCCYFLDVVEVTYFDVINILCSMFWFCLSSLSDINTYTHKNTHINAHTCMGGSHLICMLLSVTPKFYSLSISLSDHYGSSHFAAVMFHYPRIKYVSCLFGFWSSMLPCFVCVFSQPDVQETQEPLEATTLGKSSSKTQQDQSLSYGLRRRFV